MEALSFQRRRQPITAISCENYNDICGKEPENDEEDSFFELELTVPNPPDPKIYSPLTTSGASEATPFKDKPNGPAFVCRDSVERKQSTENTHTIDRKCNFSPSKRKILPIEPSFARPQSPISLLKSAPKFRLFMFGKSKSLSAHEAKKTGVMELRNGGRNFSTLRIASKEIEPALTRDSSLRKNENASCSDSPLPGESNSKRPSKEVMQKYLRLVKPLYVKASKRQTGGGKLAGELPPTVPVGSANQEVHEKAPTGFQVMACRHLGKSKSASASSTGIMSSPARRDDSLVQQHDGIESAILHCKRSLSSSRDLCSVASCERP